jgi:hypothetical protein
MSTPARLEAAIDRLRRSRLFTKQFLLDLTPDDWFWPPPEYATHIAWQVSHLAVAQYSLCLRRIRGRTTEDEQLISERFIETFKLGSKPQIGTSDNPPLDEIKRVFEAVYDQALAELPQVDNAELDSPADPPSSAFKTKLGAIEFCSQHELVHAGQIAMLRRLMGKPPLR